MKTKYKLIFDFDGTCYIFKELSNEKCAQTMLIYKKVLKFGENLTLNQQEALNHYHKLMRKEKNNAKKSN